MVRGYGQVILTQPWNPYLPLIPWIVVLLAAWAVLCGDHLMLIPLVAFATFCAQTHVPYLPLAVGLVALGLGTVAVRLVRGPADARRRPVRSIAWAVGVGIVLWLPPVADQLTNRPGNIRQLIDHFGSPPEPAIGLGDGVRLALGHLDVWAGLGGQVVDTGRFVSTASTGRGAVVLAVWVVAAIVAWRVGSAALPRPPCRDRRRPAARGGFDGPHLRAAMVLPDPLGVGHHDAAGRRGPVDRGGLVAAAPA